ncbi:thiol:disulfide interchange protein DsbA [Kitasatospora sp. SolWspMP-SS2h]|uniref:thiol:disulfide interchange protein DsbA/DsbL n=1 Tax=Kitasatospora sp. SolWspMP-SS2h TaxID=1305729 RepID=UPI000DB94BCF|nr:thiol:disulfide interchange protein DsbA/DsbL [Kitasatospora sp. SolWspMP-SS2h]RAJ33258.1 thiol:disulfide interchange protein DsbA [Kitasatospora sp. SolWspMP-SS2h]
MNSLLRTTVLLAVAGGLLAAPAAAGAASALPALPHGRQLPTLGHQFPAVQPSGPTQQHVPVPVTRPLDPAAPLPAAPKAQRAHEVVEFFWYDCSHSALLEQPLTRWAAEHRADVTLRRVPAVWTGSPDEAEQRSHARLFYALDRLGEVDRLQAAVFRAVREQGAGLTTEQSAADWVATQGVDAAKFRAAYRSAEVDRAVEDAPELFARNRIAELPTVVVDGTGRTSPTEAGGVEGMPSALDRLVADRPAD